MNVSLLNESNRRVRLKAYLNKATVYTAENHSRSDRCTLLSLISDPISGHTTRDWIPSDEIPCTNVVDCRLIKHTYEFVICAEVLGARNLTIILPIKVGSGHPRFQYNDSPAAQESVPLTSRPVIHPTNNESGAPLTMSTQLVPSNAIPDQPVAFPLVPHPGSRNPLPGQSRVVPSAPYPAASDPLSRVLPSAPYPATSNPLSYQSAVPPSGFGSDNQPPLRSSTYDPPPPYSMVTQT